VHKATLSRYERLVLDAVEALGPGARTIHMADWIRARRFDWFGHIHGRLHVTLIKLENLGLVESCWQEPSITEQQWRAGHRYRLYSRTSKLASLLAASEGEQ